MTEKLTVEDLAERWQMGTEWVRHLCENGTLPAEETAEGWLIDQKDVREYEARQYEDRDYYSPDDANQPPESIDPT